MSMANRIFKGVRRNLKEAEHPKVEAALYSWFLQQRNLHVPISSEILREKAKSFYVKITGKTDFLASSGWLDKFKLRHGIRFLKVCGERVSSDVDAVRPFQEKFLKLVKEMQLTEEQVYNCDESACFWKVLPNTTWVHKDEKSAPGRKISKDRLTFMPCCNANGSHKLPLLVIGKANKPRAFKNFHLPVLYKACKKGWMTRALFSEWFKECFIPNVTKFLLNINRPVKALLIMDNAPSHPREEDLCTDLNFKISFLPPNCTAVAQPMDQNLIQNIKVSYRKSLLSYIIKQENDDIPNVLKAINLKHAVTFLNQAWESISQINVKQSWSKLWPQLSQWDEEDTIPLIELRNKLRSESVFSDLRTIQQYIHQIDPSVTDIQINEWATGQDEIDAQTRFTDEELIDEAINVRDNVESESSVIEQSCKIKNEEAVRCFSTCIQWAEENDVAIQDVLLLKRLKESAQKIHSENMTQTKISSFFTNRPT